MTQLLPKAVGSDARKEGSDAVAAESTFWAKEHQRPRTTVSPTTSIRRASSGCRHDDIARCWRPRLVAQ